MVSKRIRRGTFVPVRDWEGVIVVDKGLSTIIAGHLIDLKRDDGHHEAVVCVQAVDERGPLTQAELADLTEAAALLAQRAKRFLGYGWKVVGWKPPTPTVECVAQSGRLEGMEGRE